MPSTQQQVAERHSTEIAFNVAGIQNGRYIGPSEIRPPVAAESTATPDDTEASERLPPEQARKRLDVLIKACDPDEHHSSIRKHKEYLVADLSPPYTLFRFVQSDSHLVSMLREHEALKERIRKIPKSKIALMCIYCKIKPDGDDEKKSCSEWTIWLEQANHENIEPDDFVAWAMRTNFKDCREKVRERRRAGRKPGAYIPAAARRVPRLSLRETAEGADITLDGREFSISKSVLDEVIAKIEQAAPAGLLHSSDDDAGADSHE
ncbi:hypothetical protein [Methylorubrum populi]|uniref:Uncharacterized protein n=1 Tax=Methylorubrum populi TaxID=223967 RepID=A0A833JAH5_9HYPH|nr:hypothetical protein [Methylorubrum populi]KAB7786371.1 hypothetical protein F8B43_1772 [Methylorubrum populi]